MSRKVVWALAIAIVLNALGDLLHGITIRDLRARIEVLEERK